MGPSPSGGFTFCGKEKIEATKRELPPSLLFMCMLKTTPVSSLLQEFIHLSSFLFFPLYNFSLYSYSTGTFILIIGMFMTLAVGEGREWVVIL